MRIGIDCRMAGTRHAGIGRYIQALITELSDLITAHDHVLVLFFRDRSQAQSILGSSRQNAIEVRYADIQHYSILEQLVLPVVFLQAKLDLLHIPHFNVPIFYPKKIVITIHDLLWHHHKGLGVTTLPAWQYWTKYLFYRLVTTLAIHRARVIFVPTQTVAHTVMRYYADAKDKIHVTYEGFSSVFSSKNYDRAIIPKNKSLLYVGSLYPHKNISVILDALTLDHRLKLTIIGARSAFQDAVKAQVKARGLSKRVIFLGYVTDEDLKKAYETCWAVVIPSLSEGFGLPGLEALASGASIIVSNIPIFKEVYKDAALFFNPLQPESFLKVANTLTQTKRKMLHLAAQKLLPMYSWQTMATQTLKKYQEVLKS